MHTEFVVTLRPKDIPRMEAHEIRTLHVDVPTDAHYELFHEPDTYVRNNCDIDSWAFQRYWTVDDVRAATEPEILRQELRTYTPARTDALIEQATDEYQRVSVFVMGDEGEFDRCVLPIPTSLKPSYVGFVLGLCPGDGTPEERDIHYAGDAMVYAISQLDTDIHGTLVDAPLDAAETILNAARECEDDIVRSLSPTSLT